MSEIRNELGQRDINSIITDLVPKRYRGTVINADPDNNCCDVRIETLNGQIVRNVPVELKDDGSFYFPTAEDVNSDAMQDSDNRDVNSQVLVEENRYGMVIKGPFITKDYYRYKGMQGLLQDMHSDSFGAAPTGYCDGSYFN